MPSLNIFYYKTHKQGDGASYNLHKLQSHLMEQTKNQKKEEDYSFGHPTMQSIKSSVLSGEPQSIVLDDPSKNFYIAAFGNNK